MDVTTSPSRLKTRQPNTPTQTTTDKQNNNPPAKQNKRRYDGWEMSASEALRVNYVTREL
ncbi:MAG: hypothetical protein R3183_02650 [Oleiphilaceae bacterium]|nr:hypothetical protein [Oleiphilaceae bacterium]